ncbi:MAG: TldD/PmbA family protein [Lachnospiraceae bacterium]|nr:TldD/PmbA family protein [Lachnospiraceae bacterium]
MKNFVSKEAFCEIKPLFIGLLKKLSNIYQNVSILVEKSNGKVFRISKSGTVIKDNMFATTGAVIRLFSEKGLYEYSFNDFSESNLNEIPSIIERNLTSVSPSSTKESIPFDEQTESLSFNKSTEYEIDPESLSDESITDSLLTLHRLAMTHSEKILDCVCIFQYLKTHKLFLSENKDLEQHIMWSNGVLQPLAASGEKTQYYLKTYSTLGGAELLSEMTSDVVTAFDYAIELLDSIPPVPGTYDVICMPDVTGLIAHEAFGHGVEMDMFVKDRALAKQFVGQKIASEFVTMHDNATTYPESGSYFFDDEGTLSHDTIIIENGILKSGINDLQSAHALQVKPTGNGRRESFERKAYTRMTNTYFEAGTSTLEEMIASIENGLLLENASSGMEDPKNWGIQCMANVGREIKNGKLTGRIFSPICLSGYVPDLLNSISMVSDSLSLSGCGYCGKGYKEWVKVSDGGAAIKARAEIS